METQEKSTLPEEQLLKIIYLIETFYIYIYLNKYSHTAFTYTDLAIQKLLSSVLIFVHKSLLCLKFTENCLPTK